MRIAGGFAKGFTIRVPKIQDIRPAQEMVRLAIFSILGERIEAAEVLDLYAGSGAYGLEALSRGANHVTFVDTNPQAIDVINYNLGHARFAGKATVIKHDALRYLVDDIQTFDIIFADPPYSYGIPKPVMVHLSEALKPGGLLIFDHAKTSIINADQTGLEVIDQRSYGATGVTILQKTSPTA